MMNLKENYTTNEMLVNNSNQPQQNQNQISNELNNKNVMNNQTNGVDIQGMGNTNGKENPNNGNVESTTKNNSKMEVTKDDHVFDSNLLVEFSGISFHFHKKPYCDTINRVEEIMNDIFKEPLNFELDEHKYIIYMKPKNGILHIPDEYYESYILNRLSDFEISEKLDYSEDNYGFMYSLYRYKRIDDVDFQPNLININTIGEFPTEKITYKKIDNNEVCVCGSGRKFKDCCKNRDTKIISKIEYRYKSNQEDGIVISLIDLENVKNPFYLDNPRKEKMDDLFNEWRKSYNDSLFKYQYTKYIRRNINFFYQDIDTLNKITDPSNISNNTIILKNGDGGVKNRSINFSFTKNEIMGFIYLLVKVGEIENDDYNGIHIEYIPTKYNPNQEDNNNEEITDKIKLSKKYFETKDLFMKLSKEERDEFTYNRLLENDDFSTDELKTIGSNVEYIMETINDYYQNLLEEKGNDYNIRTPYYTKKIEVLNNVIISFLTCDSDIEGFLEREKSDIFRIY